MEDVSASNEEGLGQGELQQQPTSSRSLPSPSRIEEIRRGQSRQRAATAPLSLPPFRGPIDFANEVRAKNGLLGGQPTPISRVEKSYNRGKKASIYRASGILCRLPRMLQRKDYEVALDMVRRARHWYKRGRHNQESIQDTEAFYVQVKGDQLLERLEQARQAHQYDQCLELAQCAHYNFKLLACLVVLRKMAPSYEIERREHLLHRFEAFKNPLQLVQGYAIEDGRQAKVDALALLQKREFAGATQRLNLAETCFHWACLESQKKAIEDIRQQAQTLSFATEADQLVQAVAQQLTPVTKKSSKDLHHQLMTSQKLFNQAQDENGVKIVQSIISIIPVIEKADKAWLYFASALEARDYDHAVQYLSETKESLASVANGLKIINSPLEHMISLVVYNTPKESSGGFISKNIIAQSIIAEIALIDGKTIMEGAELAIEENQLKKAQQLLDPAGSCFHWILQSLSPAVVLASDRTKASSVVAADVAQGLALLDRYAKVISNMKRRIAMTKTWDVRKAARSSMEVLQDIKGKIARQEGLAKADALIKTIATAATIHNQKTSSSGGRRSYEEMAHVLQEAVACYRSHGFERQALAAASTLQRLQGQAYYDSMMRAVTSAAFSKAVDLLSNARQCYQDIHEMDGDDKVVVERLVTLDQMAMYIEAEQVKQSAHDYLTKQAYDEAVCAFETVKRCLVLAKREDCLHPTLREKTSRQMVVEQALHDARVAEKKSLEAVLQGDLLQAKEHASCAQRSLEWADMTHLQQNMVEEAICMSARSRDALAYYDQGQNILLQANDRPKALELLEAAKRALAECQSIYRRLVARAGTMMISPSSSSSSPPRRLSRREGLTAAIGSAEESGNGLNFHETAIHVLKACANGLNISKLEHEYACLVADMTLDPLGKLWARGLHQDVLNLLDAAKIAYENCQDAVRLHKLGKLHQVAVLLAEYGHVVDDVKDFDQVATLLRDLRALIHELRSLPPASILTPVLPLIKGNLQREEGSEKIDLLKQALEAAASEMHQAKQLMENERYDDAKELNWKAQKSLKSAIKIRGTTTEFDEEIAHKIQALDELERLIDQRTLVKEGDAYLVRAKGALLQELYDKALAFTTEGLKRYQSARAENKVKEAADMKAQVEGERHQRHLRTSEQGVASSENSQNDEDEEELHHEQQQQQQQLRQFDSKTLITATPRSAATAQEGVVTRSSMQNLSALQSRSSSFSSQKGPSESMNETASQAGIEPTEVSSAAPAEKETSLDIAAGAGVLDGDDDVLSLPSSAPPDSQVYDVNFDEECSG